MPPTSPSLAPMLVSVILPNMERLEKYLGKAFVIASIYLLIFLGGFLLLPMFGIEKLTLPGAIELILKVATTLAAITVLVLAIVFPVASLFRRPRHMPRGPILVATTVFCLGLIFIFLNVLYVKLKTCSPTDSGAWYCNVDGKSYVGLLVLAFFLAVISGIVAWVVQKMRKKQPRKPSQV